MATPHRSRADLAQIIAEKNERVRLLETDCKRLQKEALDARVIRKEIFKLADAKPELPGWMMDSSKMPTKGPGIPVAVASDWHWGERVDSAAIGGVNSYNMEIAHARARAFFSGIITLLKRYMVVPKYEGIVLCLGGDMLSGNIHQELSETNELQTIPAMLDLFGVLVEGIDSLYREFGSVVIPCVTGNHSRNCYDYSTEILTQSGWKHINQINQSSDLVAVFNPEEDSIKYELPESWYVADYAGEMVKIASKGVNLLVTPEHTLWVKHLSGTVGGKRYKYPFSKRPAQEREWNDSWVSQGGITGWRGVAVPLEILASDRKPAITVTPDVLWAEFFGWYISEGCADDARITISQSLMVNPDKYARIKELIKLLGFEPSCRDNMIRFGSKPLEVFLNEEFGRGAKNKKLPPWLKNWPKDLLEVFIQAAMLGDGYWESETSGRYSSTSDTLIDDMQEICFKVGYSTKACKRFTSAVKGTQYVGTARNLNISKKHLRSLSKSTREFYSGVIWCPTVSTGLIVVRREGRVIISGNTLKMQSKERNYTSFDWLLYQMLEKHYEKEKKIQFLISGGVDQLFKVYKHRFLLTHGDTLGKGGDGIIGSIGPIIRGDQKTRSRNGQIGQNYETLIIGHYHQLMWIGNRVIANGSLIGYNEFAGNTLRAPYEVPRQALFCVHPEHGITYQMPILVEPEQVDKTQKWVSWIE